MLKYRKTSLALAVAALTAAAPLMAQTSDSGTEVKFSGFGTVGLVHSDNRDADFVGTSFQPNGAGRSRSTSMGPDTKLGAQMNVRFNPE